MLIRFILMDHIKQYTHHSFKLTFCGMIALMIESRKLTINIYVVANFT